ncbi:MAG: hypothetical protein K6E53_00460 [Lachnospiraceae bacterium]|nr:hypothetical protein [Lachnospiraceae bacterium]
MNYKSNKELTKDPVMLRIIGLLEEQGKTDKEFTDFLGLVPGTFSHWKYDGNRTAYLQYINPICEMLETSPNYLFRGVENMDDVAGLTPMENELIRLFRVVDAKKKRNIVDTLRLFTE